MALSKLGTGPRIRLSIGLLAGGFLGLCAVALVVGATLMEGRRHGALEVKAARAIHAHHAERVRTGAAGAPHTLAGVTDAAGVTNAAGVTGAAASQVQMSAPILAHPSALLCKEPDQLPGGVRAA